MSDNGVYNTRVRQTNTKSWKMTPNKVSIRLGDLYGPMQKQARKRKLTISMYVQGLIAADLGVPFEQLKRGRPNGDAKKGSNRVKGA